MAPRTILSLCDYTGVWCKPYRDAGYNVIQIDLQYGDDVRLFEYPGDVHGVIAQPPCTHFAGSGARWWKGKGEKALTEGLALVDACLRIIVTTNPKWWCLENPVGRLRKYIGAPTFIYQPYWYAGYADNPDEEAYTKRTCLWGDFNPPTDRKEIEPVLGSKMHLIPPSKERANLRSKTPEGFAKAFYLSNP